MRFVFDQCEKHFDKDTHQWVVDRWVPPEETLIFDDANETIAMKERFQVRDLTAPNADKWYFYNVRNVENVQAIIFCDENNKNIRPFYDTQMM
jgi:hypothetical protein